jgi:hypothetical protein
VHKSLTRLAFGVAHATPFSENAQEATPPKAESRTIENMVARPEPDVLTMAGGGLGVFGWLWQAMLNLRSDPEKVDFQCGSTINAAFNPAAGTLMPGAGIAVTSQNPKLTTKLARRETTWRGNQRSGSVDQRCRKSF